MSHSHKCPFCNILLRKSEGFLDKKFNIVPKWNNYFCDENDCLNDDMPRYSVNYNCKSDGQDGNKTSCSFMIGKYYVQIDWELNESTLSTLNGPLLMNTIKISRALNLDMSDLKSVKKHVEILLLLS